MAVVPTLGGPHLSACLRSLPRGLGAILATERPGRLAAQAAQAEVVGAPAGAGFASLANLGIEAAHHRGARFVLLLNDDAALLPGCLDALHDALERAGAAAAGPIIEDVAPPGRVQSAGFTVRAWGARVRLRSSPPAGLAPVLAPALPGAALALRVDDFLAAGAFDPGFPFYFEDVDLCLRLRARGRPVVLVPRARAIHVGGASRGSTSREALDLALVGHLRLVDRHAPGALRPALRAVVRLLAAGQRLRLGRPFSAAEALVGSPGRGRPPAP